MGVHVARVVVAGLGLLLILAALFVARFIWLSAG